MKSPALLSKRLIFVSGKGGVGKTTISLALALSAAESGRKVLLAEINSEEQIAHLLRRSPTGYHEVELLPRLWGINVNSHLAFKEYVLKQIRLKSLYQAVFENRWVRNFIDGTPGLPDLMSIGKIYALLDNYDQIIVDAPSSGQCLALLQIPSIVSSAVRIGPLSTHSQRIHSILHDRTMTAVVGVALPEEMPITETLEMSTWLKQKLDLNLGPIFLNQVVHSPFSRPEWERIKKGIPVSLAHHWSRSEMSRQYSGKLQENFADEKVVPIPFVYSREFGLTEVERISGEMERGL
ncbi:MAG: ArsA family ATPase [Deltaproteobacteria bacterium]|nr:ArsA family ATPase [Deltaproteobacteria bacterium]MBI4374787.1 ArsA family ATPase [Deltaproteobacteria bacterium]